VEFNVNWCRIASKNFDLGFTKIRDILRPGKTQAGTRDTGPEYGPSREVRDGWQP